MEDIQYNKEGVYLIGAGGFARELESWIENSEFSKNYNLIGYIDDNEKALEGYKNDFKIVDSFKNGSLWKGKNIVLGIASCEVKQKIFDDLINNDCKILSYKHNTSIIAKNTTLGVGYVLCPHVIISCNVKIGNLVSINSGSQIGHDVTIGNYSSIMANVDIGGGANIGNHVFIGSNSVILPGVKIPDYTRIGAGSVVLRTLKSSGSYFGNPAKKIF